MSEAMGAAPDLGQGEAIRQTEARDIRPGHVVLYAGRRRSIADARLAWNDCIRLLFTDAAETTVPSHRPLDRVVPA